MKETYKNYIMKTTILIFSLFAATAFGQEQVEEFNSEIDSVTYNVFTEKVQFWQMEKMFKFSPFDVISAIPTFGLDLETTMKSGTSFQYGAAFIPSAFQPIVREGENGFRWMNGYRLRFESRFYTFKKPSRYISTEASFRHLIISDDASIGMEGDGNGNFAYFTKENKLYNRFSMQINTKLGFEKIYGKFVLDFYGGLSLRYNKTATRDVENGGELQSDWNPLGWDLSGGRGFTYATPIIGLKLGFRVPPKKNL
jgi:hypothetical protein